MAFTASLILFDLLGASLLLIYVLGSPLVLADQNIIKKGRKLHK